MQSNSHKGRTTYCSNLKKLCYSGDKSSLFHSILNSIFRTNHLNAENEHKMCGVPQYEVICSSSGIPAVKLGKIVVRLNQLISTHHVTWESCLFRATRGCLRGLYTTTAMTMYSASKNTERPTVRPVR